MFLPPSSSSEFVVGEKVWPRSRTDGWAEGLAEVSFSFSLTALPPSCRVTSLTRVCVCVCGEVGDEKSLPALCMGNPDKAAAASSSPNVCLRWDL